MLQKKLQCLKKIKTNTLSEFTKHFVKTEIKDTNNVRASTVLANPPEQNFFSIQQTSLARSLIKFPIPPHRVDFYELLIIKKGRNLRSINLYSFELNDFSFSITLPGHIVTDNLITEHIDGYHLYFDNAFLMQVDKHLLHTKLFNPENITCGTLNEREFIIVENLLYRLEELYIQYQNEHLLKNYFKTLILELNDIFCRHSLSLKEKNLKMIKHMPFVC
jgi:hypothetical protein